MATAKTLNDLILNFMQDIYYAERQILKALPKMAKAAQSDDLKQALMHHREETEGQVERVQKAFDALGKRARARTCEAINGLIEEGEEVIEEFAEGTVRDAGILANAQAVEHYEMARYGTVIEWAKRPRRGGEAHARDPGGGEEGRHAPQRACQEEHQSAGCLRQWHRARRL